MILIVALVLSAGIVAVALKGRNVDATLGAIRVTSKPTQTAQVYLDSRKIGDTTPVQVNDIALGQHRLKVEATGFITREHEFELSDDQLFEIEFHLDPVAQPDQQEEKTGVIAVVSEPEGAEIRVNGVTFGTAPITIDKLPLGQEMIVEGILKGHKPKTIRASFEKGSDHRMVAIHLDPIPAPSPPQKDSQDDDIQPMAGTSENANSDDDTPANSNNKSECTGSAASISVMPVGVADCKVTVGGQSIGVAPLFRKPAPQGTCEVAVKCPNGKQTNKRWLLVPGKETRWIIRRSDW